MKQIVNGSPDRELCARILDGVAASSAFQERFRKSLEGFLVGMCDRGDGRSQEKAVEIASQTLADCFAKSPSLLERWQGDDNLEAFLRTAGHNRLKSWWVSSEKRRTEVNSDSLVIANTPGLGSVTDAEESEIVVADKALRAGIAEAARTCPEGLVFMRLKGLHGVDQRAISQCWAHHEAQTSRRIKEAMETIRNTARAEAERAGLDLSIDALQEAIHRNPAILLGGGEGSQEGSGDDSLLRKLAAREADAADRKKAAVLMCGNCRMLEFFAQLLNRGSARDAVVHKDPALAGMDARLGECIRRSLDVLPPGEARYFISPLMADSFQDVLRGIGADGGTLWLLSPGTSTLEAVFNPLEPEIAGKRQSLVSGIISLVLANGETCCVNSVERHSSHSPAIDIAMGKTTHSMIAVPFNLFGSARGVLTAVRLSGDEDFGAKETGILERHANLLVELFVSNLSRHITS